MNSREVYNSFRDSIQFDENRFNGKTFKEWVNDDKPRARMYFNDYIDQLHKDGEIKDITRNTIYLNKFIKCE